MKCPFYSQFCSQNVHKRKIDKSCLLSWILIRYDFQHDFLGLFIRSSTNNKKRSTFSQVAKTIFVKNQSECRIKSQKYGVCTQFFFTFDQDIPLALLTGKSFYFLNFLLKILKSARFCIVLYKKYSYLKFYH